MRARRRGAVFAVGCAAVILGVASTAWACFAPGTDPVVTVTPNRATAGSRVVITGTNWAAQSLTVRWGDATWPTAGSPVDGSFSLAVIVPEVSPGVHYLTVLQPGASPTTSLAIEVEAARPTAGNPGGTTRTGNATSGATRAGVKPADAVNPGAVDQEAAVATVADTATSGLPTAPSGTASPSVAAPSKPAPGAATAASRSPARTGSPLSRLLPSSPVPVAPTVDEVAPAVPPAASASGVGPWSGFEKDLGTRTPTLVNPTGADQSSGPSQAMLAVGMLMAGLVALFAGFGVAELRRRTAPVARRKL